MARIAPEVGARIGYFLAYLSREWESVPDLAEDFPAWDEMEQFEFVHEWDIRESGIPVSATTPLKAS